MQQAAPGVCGPSVSKLPYSAEAVADVLAFNQAVLARSGFSTVTRARVMIIDSGLPRALIDHPLVRPVLDVNRFDLLAAGSTQNSAEDPTPSGCGNPDGDSAAGWLSGTFPKSRFGITGSLARRRSLCQHRAACASIPIDGMTPRMVRLLPHWQREDRDCSMFGLRFADHVAIAMARNAASRLLTARRGPVRCTRY